MRKISILIAFIIAISFNCEANNKISTIDSTAQSEPQEVKKEQIRVVLALGLGIDYGGIGGKISFLLNDNISLFGGGGLAIYAPGFNVGGKIRAFAKRKVSPFAIFMYGYHTIIKWTSSSEILNGINTGLGIDINFGNSKSECNCLSIALIIPNSFADVNKYIEENNIELKTKLPPIRFSIGYQFKYR
ncbi:MAG: hypothetical protein MI739_03160 [Bacteroidales bacterium]|nr:hypothetical protein [Bacteroidales bacterium]